MLNKMLLAGARTRMTTQMSTLLPLCHANHRLFHSIQAQQLRQTYTMNSLFTHTRRNFMADGAVATQEET